MAIGAINPAEPTAAEEQSAAFSEIGGGKQFIARGFDITALPIEDIFGKKAISQLEAAGVDISKPIRLDELRAFMDENDLVGNQLDRDFRKALQQEGLFFKGGRLASQSLLEKTTLDVAGPEAIDEVRGGAMENLVAGQDLVAQGMALAGGRIDDPLARDLMRRFNEQFGMSQAARGMGTQFGSGQASLQSVTGGLSFLSQFGQGMIGAGQAGIETAFAVDPFLNPQFALSREDLRFDRELFDFQFKKMLEQQHRAKQWLNEQIWWSRAQSGSTLGLSSTPPIVQSFQGNGQQGTDQQSGQGQESGGSGSGILSKIFG